MTTAYVRSFVESVSGLPAELRRISKRMRELDATAAALQQQTEQQWAEQLAEAAKQEQECKEELGSAKRQRLIRGEHGSLQEQVEADASAALAVADEKVLLAQKLYDYVDVRIIKTDKMLRELDAELGRMRAALGVPQQAQMPVGAALDPATAKQKGAAGQAVPGGAIPVVGGSATDGAVAGVSPVLAEVEPVYCYCKRISFGQMIACDNETCETEWFHVECVGLNPDRLPKKWFCKDCKEARRTHKLK